VCPASAAVLRLADPGESGDRGTLGTPGYCGGRGPGRKLAQVRAPARPPLWKAEAMLALAGPAVRDVAFITSDSIEGGLGAHGQILTWAEKPRSHAFFGENPLLLMAYRLHYAFTPAKRSFVKEQFTGRDPGERGRAISRSQPSAAADISTVRWWLTSRCCAARGIGRTSIARCLDHTAPHDRSMVTSSGMIFGDLTHGGSYGSLSRLRLLPEDPLPRATI
jgi:hypothetical protein